MRNVSDDCNTFMFHGDKMFMSRLIEKWIQTKYRWQNLSF